jgi:hypothetical protein
LELRGAFRNEVQLGLTGADRKSGEGYQVHASLAQMFQQSTRFSWPVANGCIEVLDPSHRVIHRKPPSLMRAATLEDDSSFRLARAMNFLEASNSFLGEEYTPVWSASKAAVGG